MGSRAKANPIKLAIISPISKPTVPARRSCPERDPRLNSIRWIAAQIRRKIKWDKIYPTTAPTKAPTTYAITVRTVRLKNPVASPSNSALKKGVVMSSSANTTKIMATTRTMSQRMSVSASLCTFTRRALPVSRSALEERWSSDILRHLPQMILNLLKLFNYIMYPCRFPGNPSLQSL